MRCSKALVVVAVVATLVPATCGCGREFRLKRSANRFLSYLVAEDYTAAGRYFDADLAEKLPPARIRDSWDRFLRVVGPYQRKRGTRAVAEGGATVVYITCVFERRTMEMKLTFNHSGKITDLRLLAPEGESKPQAARAGSAPRAPARQPQAAGGRPSERARAVSSASRGERAGSSARPVGR